MADKQVLGIEFSGMFVSLDLVSRFVIPCVNDCGLVSGFFMALLEQLVMFSLTESKVFYQKPGKCSIPSNIHFLAF